MVPAAAVSASAPEVCNGKGGSLDESMSTEEIRGAIAKAVELRAIRATLMQQDNIIVNNNNNNGIVSSPSFPSIVSPSRSLPQLSAQDYPVFTPCWEEQLLSKYQQIHLDDHNQAKNWTEQDTRGAANGDGNILFDHKNLSTSSRRGPISLERQQIRLPGPDQDQRSVTGSSSNRISGLHRVSPGTDFCKSWRHSLGDFSSAIRDSNVVMPLSDPHSCIHPRPKSRGLNLSWLFSLSRLRKKPYRKESSPESKHEAEMATMEALKKEIVEANARRDAALVEVEEMRSSLGWLKQKLEHLESHCEELKAALRQLTGDQGIGESAMPVNEEVMVEGFLQIVSESRLSVKQFCRALIGHAGVAASEGDHHDTPVEGLNSLLEPHKLTVNSKYSKAVSYHLEAIMNQLMYEDFENCVFRRNGTPKALDPKQDREEQFASFVALRNLSWNEVLRKGTKQYSEEFSRFCDQKMGAIVGALNWKRPWPEELLQGFFVAAKCVWLLHLLAFSFRPPLGILRVEENRRFDPNYMEDVLDVRQRKQGGSPSRVNVMVMPGFYMLNRLLRCKVLCRYKSVPN